MMAEGAQPVPISAADRGKLDLFLASLDGRRLHLGVRESLRAHELFVAVAESATPAAYARAMFTSLLARTPAEQGQIAAEFDKVFLPSGPPPPLVQPQTPPKPGLSQMLGSLARRLDPAWIAVFLSVAAALAIDIWLLSDTMVTPIVRPEPPPVTTTAPPPDTTVPKPEIPDGVWTTATLLQDIDRLISEARLSAAPTLRELQKAGWPPPELRGGVPMPLAELVRRTGLSPNIPLNLEDERTRSHLVNGMQALGVIPVPLTYQFASPASVYASGLSDGAFAFVSNGGFNDIALPRQQRIDALRGFLGASLQPPPVGVDQDDLLDRAFFLAMAKSNPAPKGFADATWAPPPAAAVTTASPLLGVIAAILPLIILALWFWHWSGLRRLYVHQRHGLTDNPLQNRTVLNAPADILKNRTDKAWMASVARSLNVRQHVAFLAVDPERTVQATIASGGLFNPVAGEITSSPAYLVLIEARNGFDQEAQRLEALYLRLVDAGTAAVRFFYFDSPALLHAAWDAPGESIHDIAAQHGDRRLIILGEGRSYLNPLTLKPEPWARALTLWPDRAMLTPKPIAEWAAEDYALARQLEMPLGRATVEGLAAIAGLMGLGGGNQPASQAYGFVAGGDIHPLPPLIRARPHYWTSENDPDEDDADLTEWQRLEAALRAYLDTPGLMWLAALSIYPALQWDLTLYLGRNLELGGSELYAEPRLAALTRLPWLRNGSMPEWLRVQLMKLLPAALKLKTVELIWAIMKTEAESPDRPLVQLRQGATVNNRGRRPTADPLFLSTMQDEDGFPLPAHLKPGLGAQCLDFLKLQWDKLAIAGLLSIIAWRVTPGAATLRPGAYMPLTLLFALPVVAWVWVKVQDGTARKYIPVQLWTDFIAWLKRLMTRPATISQSASVPDQPSIFVSHFKPYEVSEGSLEEALWQRGFNILGDGQSAAEAIAEASIFISLLTPSGFSSKMEQELNAAIEKKIPTHVARIGDVETPGAIKRLGLPVIKICHPDLSLDKAAVDRFADMLRQSQGVAA